MINSQKDIIIKLFKKLYLILNRIRFYKERRFLNKIYENYINNNDRAHNILKLKVNNSMKDLIGERDLPSNERFQKTGWWKNMLWRYGLAMHFSKGKDVLETCSGLGWGAYLLDGVARTVTCIEIEKESINLSKNLWKTDRTSYIEGSVLKIPANDNKYDVVTAMESIEHFKLEDIKIYLSEIYRVLKQDGVLIGSSSFPDTIEEANALCSKNKYHLHICTNHEIKELLREQGFKKIKVFQNRLFFITRRRRRLLWEKSQHQIGGSAKIGSLKPKQIEELNFWKNISENGWRGFTPEEWRIAHIHFKQYSLMYINRNIGDLENKVVIEIGCGPAGIIPYLNNVTAIGVDPLLDEYKKMWDLSNDKVKYICSETETFKIDIQADVVICWNVLDHVSDIELATKKLFNILKPDGELWFMINLQDTGGSGKIVKKEANSAHPYRVNIVSISRLMKKHGFFWKEKVLMKDSLNKRHPVLMGILGKSISDKKGQRKVVPKMKQLYSNFKKLIVP